MSFRNFPNTSCWLLLCSILLGCQKNPAELDISKDEIMPLAVGNYWTYLVS